MSFFKKLRSKLPSSLQHSKIWDKPNKQGQQRLSFDQQLINQTVSKKRLPSLRQFRYISSFFSARERFVVGMALLAIIVTAGLTAFFFYASFVKTIPAKGGAYREALIGTPIYINPVLASTNDVDLDLVKLLYSGLLRYDENLELQNDLAESYTISEDQTVYTLTLRNDATFHDGKPVTANDVLFTYNAISDPIVNSPLQLSLQNVQIKKVGENIVQFTLPEPFAPFVSLLTIGILPEHLWAEIPAGNMRLAELNIKPIGSGPYKFSRLEKERSGTIHSYSLAAFDEHYDRAPYISEISFRFFQFPDFGSAIESLNNNQVDGLSFIPRELIDNLRNTQSLQPSYLEFPQYTALFFNQDKNEALQDFDVRQALAYAIDRDRLLEEVLDGLGKLANGPLVEDFDGFEGYPYNPLEAKKILENVGYREITAEEYITTEKQRIFDERKELAEELGEEFTLTLDDILVNAGGQVTFRIKDDDILTVRVTTVDQPENHRALELIRNSWQSIGIRVETEITSATELTTAILPRRDYEALLYGQILNVYPDLYTYWHSSQIEYPGLNFSGFSEKSADELLEEVRKTSDLTKQEELYKDLYKVFDQELPAIFLYHPKYTYILPTKINGMEVKKIAVPADRFNDVTDWYIKTAREFQWR